MNLFEADDKSTMIREKQYFFKSSQGVFDV